jgi:hypothetical protein
VVVVVVVVVVVGHPLVRATRLAIGECFPFESTASTPSLWAVPQPSLPNVCRYNLARLGWSLCADVACLDWTRLSR